MSSLQNRKNIGAQPPDEVPFSIVVVVDSDTTDSRCDFSHLQGSLDSIAHQVGSPPLEVIVPFPAGLGGIDAVQQCFPDVIWFPCTDLKTYTGQGGSREHHDELRGCGLAIARGKLVGLLEDHARPDRHWVAAMIEAHHEPYAAIGGAMDNGITNALNWAVFFCDFGKYQNPVPLGETFSVSDVNVVYKRAILESIRPVWQNSFHEGFVNEALLEAGHKLALCRKAVVFQYRVGLRLSTAVKERFIWGRSYAVGRVRSLGSVKRLTLGMLCPALPVVLVFRMTSNVFRRGRNRFDFLRALPLTILLTISWSFGEAWGYLWGPAGPAGRPEKSEVATLPADLTSFPK